MDAHPSHGKVYEVNVLARNDENELPVSKFVRDMALKLHKVTQAIEAPKESHSAQLCALQESQNAQHSELPGNCNSLRVHIAREPQHVPAGVDASAAAHPRAARRTAPGLINRAARHSRRRLLFTVFAWQPLLDRAHRMRHVFARARTCHTRTPHTHTR